MDSSAHHDTVGGEFRPGQASEGSTADKKPKKRKKNSMPKLVIFFGFRIPKKNGIKMQPPRMALTLSGGPGNTKKQQCG